jgi:hypothetical protein
MKFSNLILPLALALLALPLSAEIVLLTNGRTMKVAEYHVAGSMVELTLKGGGTIRMALDQIERVVDDEVEDPVEPVPGKERIASGVFPDRSWTYHPDSRPIFGSKYDETIIAAAKKFNVDAALVSAVIKAESSYNPRAVSHKGAQGLMQLMPATAKRFGVTNSFDPVANIYGGTKYLRWLLQTFDGNADLAVAAYNAGEGNVWKYEGVPPFRETREYIRRIARHFHPAGGSAATSIASSR